MKDRERKVIQRRQPLNDRQKLIMLTVLIRQATSFEVAREQLEPERFGDLEREYRLTWRTVLDFYEEHEALPSKAELLAELQVRLEDDPEALEADEIERLDRLVATVYSLPRKSLKSSVGLGYLQRFLHDCLAEDLRTLFQVEQTTPEELGSYLERAVEETHRIDTLKDVAVDVPFPNDWDRIPPVNKTKTLFNWLDTFLNGGEATGEIVAYAAPFGTCKTLLATQLSTRGARHYAMEFDGHKHTADAVLKLSYHVTYEEPLRMLRIRALSYIGMIDRNNLESGKLADLSTMRNLCKYERNMHKFNELALECEQGRREAASRWLNLNWRVLDFTGSHGGRQHLGNGGVPEIVQAIRRDLARMSKKAGVRCVVGRIVLDYVGIACKRMLEAKGMSQSQELRHALGMFPDQCKRLLAERFNCCVHIFAQLSGSVAGLAPGVVCQRTDTAENKLLLENADFGITLGNITADGMIVASLQKARRGKFPQHVVLYVNGLMCRLEDTRGEWVLYERGRKIVSKSELSRINMGTAGGPLFRNGQPVRKLNLRKTQTDAMLD